MSIRMILCEGYHDRAFWKGWLESRGCVDAGKPPGRSTRKTVLYPWGDEVKSGAHAYRTRSDELLVVRPVEGNSRLLKEAKNLFARADKGSVEIDWMVISADADLYEDGTTSDGYLMTEVKLRDFLSRESLGSITEPNGVYVLDRGTRVRLLSWTASDPSTSAVPDQQTLERLVCCALCATYPVRTKPIQDWLDSRPEPPDSGVKEFAWSQMAGWYAKHGCEDFYAHVWRDERVAAELEQRLCSTGAWDIVEAMTS